MMELLVILTFFTGGSLLVRLLGIRGWGLPPLGFIVGVCVYVLIGALQVFLFLPTTPIVTLTLTLLIPLLLWLNAIRNGRDVKIKVIPLIIAVFSITVMVYGLRHADLFKWHTDSFFYIEVSSLLAQNEYNDHVSFKVLPKRELAVPLIHDSANLYNEIYLRSVTPLLSLATLMTIVWFLRMAIYKLVSKRLFWVYAAVGVLLLVSNNRFVWHSFYINGHLLFGSLLLMVVGTSWLLSSRVKGISPTSLIILQALVLPALVFTRAEAPIIAGLALLPVLLNKSIPRRLRSIPLIALGVPTILWNGFLIYKYVAASAPPPHFATNSLLIGVACLIGIWLLRWDWITKRARLILIGIEVLLWLALLGMFIHNPDILTASLGATYENTIFSDTSWGSSLVLLSAMIGLALLFLKFPEQVYLRFPVTTFIPTVFILAYLREAAYRVGNGDSLNRMIVQIMPVAILLLVATVAIGTLRFTRAKTTARTKKLRRT